MIRRVVRIMIALISFSSVCIAEQPVQWPREFKVEGHEVVLFQPQVEIWTDFKFLKMRSALKVTLAGSDKSYYGALTLEADAVTNHDELLVLLVNGRITDLSFPNADEAAARQCAAVARKALDPRIRPIEVPLEQIAANVERTQIQQRTIHVNRAPPPIYYSSTSAVLVMFMGEPIFEMVPDTKLLFAVNTNWDILMEMDTGNYYLLNGDSWLVTKDPKTGPWAPVSTLPKSFSQLPNNENWADVKKHIPGKPAKTTPKVFFSTEPAELIVTTGAPSYSPCPDTKLLYVNNTGHDLFLLPSPSEYYLLTAGRWFRAASLSGPWQSAAHNLPSEFAAISPDGSKAHVLASVPGSAEADAAVLLASVPQKATVQRNEVSINVVYEGAPDFMVIEGTQVSYALNSLHSVFVVKGRYYCCHQSIWFESAVPTGPWIVCAKVPKEIYTIPSTHPMHNVTYVYIYDSTPDTVVVGCTSGYRGEYIAGGVLLFGLGYAIGHHDDHYHSHYYYHHHGAHYYSYGCDTHYDHYHGSYYREGSVHGPYGGAGHYAGYNAASGTYTRGAARYGPNGGAFAREAYNPYTDRYAGQVGASTPYGSWGRSVVSDGDDWTRAGHRSQNGKTVGGIETSEGGKLAAGYNQRSGSGGYVGKDKDGDVYAGRDGNVYKRGDDNWKKYDGNDWKPVEPQARDNQARTEITGDSRTRPDTRTPSTSQDASTQNKTYQQLNRDSEKRSSANRTYQSRATRSSSSRSRGSRSSGGRSSGSRSGGGRR